MMTVVAPIFGPIFGGLISDNWNWAWIFYINIGFGLLVGLGSWSILRGRETPTERSRIDGIGLALLVTFVTAFQVTIDKGRELDWFSSSFIVACASVSAISLIFLVIWELTEANPIIDLTVFRSRNWLVSTVTLCLMFGIFFGNIVLTPLWLQQQMNYTATWAGYAMAPMGLLAVMTSPIVGRLLPKADPRLIVTFGMGVLAFSFFMRAHFTSQSDYMSVALPMLVLGAGIPACMITLTSLGVSDLDAERIASGAGLQNFLRVLSMAIGSSLTLTYWEHMTKANRSELVAIIRPEMPTVIASKLAQSGIPRGLANTLFSRMVDGQAVMLATNDFYALATILMLTSIAVVWVVKRPKGPLKAIAH
jgi:DHA2 family multidrug resistance protein